MEVSSWSAKGAGVEAGAPFGVLRIAVSKKLTNVTVAGLEGMADSITHLTLRRLPGTQTDRGD